MKFGAHISGAGSLPGVVEKANSLGAQCIQLFASPPSNWNKPRYLEPEMTEFKTLTSQAKLGPNFFHAIYLLNLGSDNPDLLAKSISSLTGYLTIAPQMG